MCIFYLIEQHSQFLLHTLQLLYMCTVCDSTGLFEMTVGVLQLVIHNTLEIGVYVFFYLIEQHSQFLLHTLQVLYMCTVCDSTNINTIVQFVPNCL